VKKGYEAIRCLILLIRARIEPATKCWKATNVICATISSETGVEDKFYVSVNTAGEKVFDDFPFSGAYSKNNFCHVVKKNNRSVAVSLKQAFVEALQKDKDSTISDLKRAICFSKVEETFWLLKDEF